MLYPQKVIEGFKDTAETLGTINTAQKYLMELLDPQNMNTFEILIAPASLGKGAKQIAKQVARIATDSLIARLHLQTVSFGFDGVAFERANDHTYAKSMERVNEVTMTFIENDLAIMRNYIMDWMEDVVEFNPITNAYVFKEDQMFARRNCKIILQMGSGIPTPGWITISGMRPTKISDITIGHTEEEPWKMEVMFSVDYAKLSTLLQLF